MSISLNICSIERKGRFRQRGGVFGGRIVIVLEKSSYKLKCESLLLTVDSYHHEHSFELTLGNHLLPSGKLVFTLC